MEEDAVIVEKVTKFFKINKKIRFFGNYENSNVITALDDISFTIKKGEMLGIMGLNGSGKTTLLRTIAGIYKPDFGSIKVKGILAPLLQIGTGFNAELTAHENIMMYCLLLGLKKHEIKHRTRSIIEFAELGRFSEMKLKNYSSGMRARLAFSCALQVNPDILLVDEALAVGDRAFREKSYEEFLSFKKNGKTILYTTHSTEKISELADKVLILNKGKVRFIGNPDEAIQKYNKIIMRKKERRDEILKNRGNKQK